MTQAGYSDNGATYIESGQQVYSDQNAFHLAAGADASWVYSPQSGDSISGYFHKYNVADYWTNDVYFDSNITRLSLNADANNVPEPTSAWLAGVALLGAASVTRRARKHRAG